MLFLFQILKISIRCPFVRSIFNSITETLPILNMSSINSYAKLFTLIFPSPFLVSPASRNVLQSMPSFPRLSLLFWYLPCVWHPDILETAYMTFILCSNIIQIHTIFERSITKILYDYTMLGWQDGSWVMESGCQAWRFGTHMEG